MMVKRIGLVVMCLVMAATVSAQENDGADDTFPLWSPDGSQIAFSTTRNGTSELFVMDVRGGVLGYV